MWRKVGSFGLLLLVLVMPVFAAVAADNTNAAVDNAVQARVDDANRYLSAEAAKQIKAMGDSIIADVNNYNDKNFGEFDTRLQRFLQDTRLQVIMGGVGAVLLANAIVAIILAQLQKRYSLEYYQNQIIGKHQQDMDEIKAAYAELKGMLELQNKQWVAPVPQNTIGLEYGQPMVSDMTQMNEWQMQAAHPGAWQAPAPDNTQYYQPPPPPNSEYQQNQ